MLPVVEHGRLVGILKDSDLEKAQPSEVTTLEIHELLYLLSTVQVKDIMSRKPITVPANFTIEETAEILVDHKIPGVPVMGDDGAVLGVITHTDLFRVIVSLTGISKRGIQFAFQLKDKEGSIMEVAHVMRGFGGRIGSILTSYERVPEGYRNVYIRMYDITRDKLDALKVALRKEFVLLYIMDHKNNIREIYQDSLLPG
jgi:acetoin utilization protein AcuB